MSMPSAQPPSHSIPARHYPFPTWQLGLVVAVAMSSRAWLQFSTPLAPGINGAYYFVQARAILEHGISGVPDLPLTFWFHASLAWVIEHLTSLPRDASIILAVKSTDSILPPLAAIPIAWLGWNWQRSQPRPSRVAAVAPAALVCLVMPALRMVGDFQKNSLALILLATLAAVAHRYLQQPRWQSALGSLGLMALIALTHIGTLGVALVFAALVMVCAAVIGTAQIRRWLAYLTLTSVVVLGITGAMIYRKYDSGRIIRLVKAFVQPSSFLDERNQPRQSGQPANLSQPPLAPRGNFDLPRRPLPLGPDDSHRAAPLMRPPHGPQGQLRQLAKAPGFLFLAVGLTGLVVAWYRRKISPPADTTLLVAAALTAAALGGPFFDMDKALRLMLIALVPGAITLSYLLATINHLVVRRTLGALVFTSVIASAAIYLSHSGRPSISEATYAELQSLSRYIITTERNLVIARHGLEWWAAWVLHTHIAQPRAVVPSDWSKYDHIFYLSEKHLPRPPGGRGFEGNQPPSGGWPRPMNPDRANFDNGRGPSLFGVRPRDFSGDSLGGGVPGMDQAQIPRDAVTLFDGTELRFALAPTAPDAEVPATFDGPPI